MNDVQVFNNDEFGSLRTIWLNGVLWFVGKDVAQALNYTNPQKALRDHVEKEDTTVNESFTVNGTNVTLINESGLYSLILSSKLPSAKRFKRWVTSEVLPSLRRSGHYTTGGESGAAPQRMLTVDDYFKAASIISTCRNERLPYVLGLLKQGGIELPKVKEAVLEDCRCEAARLINKAKIAYGVSYTQIGKLTRLPTTTITRIASGAQIPTNQRAICIVEAVKKAVPGISV